MKYLFRNKVYIFFLLPGLILYCLFMVYPLISALGYSAFSWDGLMRGEFIGVDNFKRILTGVNYKMRFWGALWHNAKFFIFFCSSNHIRSVPGPETIQ